MRTIEVPELVSRSLSVEQIASAVASDPGLDLATLRTPSRRAKASRARALTAYLGFKTPTTSAAESTTSYAA
jgi:chromosomal replication initiation ATPase DnaA